MTPLRVAYADPPYLGCCGLYKHRHDDGCWNDVDTHRQLITRLCDEFPDGWALSASSPSLRTLLPLCPSDVRVAAWVKSFCAFKRGVRPAYAWEPVIYRGGRNKHHPPPEKNGKQTTPKDFIVEPITLKKGLTGAKPIRVCEWILSLLNVQVGDHVEDLFPGTDVMSLAVARVAIYGVTGADGFHHEGAHDDADEGRPMLTAADFGRDHWSTLLYIETLTVDNGGVPDHRRMRTSIKRHPHLYRDFHGATDGTEYPTRLAGGKLQPDHDDWDCADDLEREGFIVIKGTGVKPTFALTTKGQFRAAELRAERAVRNLP